MSVIRSLLPDVINKPLMYRFGKFLNSYNYYCKTKKFTADEVYPGIYIGDLLSSMARDEMKEKNIHNILSVLNGSQVNYPTDFNYERIHLNDDSWVKISQHFDNGVKFIEDSLDRGEGVLVHCRMGASRSVAVVIAYLIKKTGKTPQEILDEIQKKRLVADPNPGFMNELDAYYFRQKMSKSCAEISNKPLIVE